jgi:hypothetical protein
METLSRACSRAGAALVLAVLVGCATGPVAEPVPEAEYWREVVVQTIPRGGYIERNNEYIGMAPASVWVRTSRSGYPLGDVVIRGTDTPTGAHVWRRLQRGQPVPTRMLLDIRPWLVRPDSLMLGP